MNLIKCHEYVEILKRMRKDELTYAECGDSIQSESRKLPIFLVEDLWAFFQFLLRGGGVDRGGGPKGHWRGVTRGKKSQGMWRHRPQGQDVAQFLPSLQDIHRSPFSRVHILHSGVAFPRLWFEEARVWEEMPEVGKTFLPRAGQAMVSKFRS